ncbi:MAG: hypothetical protein H5T50_07040 [Nitrososphaeria archaeon]|nr:hypothetical protein [Nitrososphaeria archaeon]
MMGIKNIAFAALFIPTIVIVLFYIFKSEIFWVTIGERIKEGIIANSQNIVVGIVFISIVFIVAYILATRESYGSI